MNGQRKRERKRIIRMHMSRNLIYTTRKYRAILTIGRYSYLDSLLYSHEVGSALVTPD